MLPFTLNYEIEIKTMLTQYQIEMALKSMINQNKIYYAEGKEEQLTGKVSTYVFRAKTVGRSGYWHDPITFNGAIEDLGDKRKVTIKSNFGFYPWYCIVLLSIINIFYYYLIIDTGFNVFSGMEYLFPLPFLMLLSIYFLFVIMFNKRIKKFEMVFRANLNK